MASSFELNAETRQDKGKGASRRLRRDNKVPAVLYGAGKDAVSLTLQHNKLLQSLENEAFYSHILTVNVDGKAEKAVLKDLQRHPYKPSIIHVDLLRINENEKLRMNVPIHFIGEDVSVGVKAGGVISHLANDVEILCLPKDLPEFIEADLSGVNLDETLHLSDLKLPAGVELVALTHGSDHDLSVAAIHMPKVVAEVESEAPVAPDAGEAEGENA
ncbi:MAG TPA: 50S ribosomal protein L25/general stress protein Ctc [Chromatiales bacterium]|nr:50S ribosomal protein L25/general stress protein Ctc [Chromatiales bacterium]